MMAVNTSIIKTQYNGASFNIAPPAMGAAKLITAPNVLLMPFTRIRFSLGTS